MLKPVTMRTWTLKPIRWWQILLELGVIFVVFWLVTQNLHNFSDDFQPTGNDLVTVTRSADYAGQFLRSHGKIPIWDPFIGNGEPMLESFASFILNPFVSLPIMLLGANPGVLITILLHGLLTGWGGWALGRATGLGAPGRLLLGALLVSSGSVTGQLTHGSLALAVSQAYIPFIYAGLITIFFLPQRRRGLLLLVVATALLIFGGSLWYVMPVAFGCAVMTLFALIDFKAMRPSIDLSRLGMVLVAGLFAVGVCAIRLLAVNRDYLFHPSVSYDIELSYPQAFLNYFDPGYTTDRGAWYIVYHYVVPGYLMLALVPLALLTWRWVKHEVVGGWRMIVAVLVVVLVITMFATGPTPLVNSIYDAIPFLKDWRNQGRLAAGSSLWIVFFAAWFFDRLALFAERLLRQPRAAQKLLGAVGLVALAGAGISSAAQIGNNWPISIQLFSTHDIFAPEPLAAHTLRQIYPSQFLNIHAGWQLHNALNQNLIRHQYGDFDVFAIGAPPTIGVEQQDYYEEFAFGDWPDSGNGRWLKENGYIPLPNVPVYKELGPILDYNPDALPYAFIVPEQTLIDIGDKRLVRGQTQAVTYFHQIDQVILDLQDVPPGQVLVILETAYPGWTASVNGVTLPTESVNRRLAVRLPATTGQATVVFSYRPTRLYTGALISVLSIILLVAYVLGFDRLLWRRVKPVSPASGGGFIETVSVAAGVSAFPERLPDPAVVVEQIPYDATVSVSKPVPESVSDELEPLEVGSAQSTRWIVGAAIGVVSIVALGLIGRVWRRRR